VSEERRDWDAIVIGLRAIGSAAAYWLSTRLHDRVLGLEQFELGHPTSPAVAPLPGFGPAGVDEVVLHGVLARVARERRASRRRRWAVAGVAAAVAGVLVAGGLLLTGVLGERDAGRRVQLAGGPVSGSAVLVDAEQGTRIALEVTGLAPGRYGVWLEDQEGQRVSAGSFRPDADGWASVDLLAGLPLEDSEAIGVTVAGGEDLLREELAPGQAGTGRVGPG
jgi:hypothetical protein